MSDETNKQTPPPSTHVVGLEKAVRTHLKWFERFICDENELNSSTPRKVSQNGQDAAAELRAALSLLHQTNAAEQHPDDLVPQSFDEVVENCLRMWFFNYDETADHSGHRIAMREIVRFVQSQGRSAIPSTEAANND